jgi:nucleoside-diphosphate-sugar epimerase
MNVANLFEPSLSRGTALVTGSAGFTGRYVRDELQSAGFRVAGMAHGIPHSEDNYPVDLLDSGAVKQLVSDLRPDVVVHLAAIAFVAHGDAEEIYRTNIVGTRNLLQALALSSHKPRSVLLASSANVYGNAEAGRLSEDISPAPANDYAVSKMAMEYMAKLWMDRLPIVIARPFNYTGVGQSENFLISKIVAHFKRGDRKIELGNINVSRDFQDVRFVANAYRRLVETDMAAGEVVNLCSGVGYSLTDVVDIVQKLARYEIEVVQNPAFMRANEVKRLIGSNEKLRGLIGELDIIPLEETLAWMYDSRL